MSFKGVRPSGQPRPLRGIAEDVGTMPANFVDGGVAPASGLPDSIRGAQEAYLDLAENVIQPAPSVGLNPMPFATLRKGR